MPSDPAPRSVAGAKRAKEQMLVALSEGLTVKDACARVGRTVSAYEQWRLKDSEFKARVTAVRSGLKAKPGGWSGGFAEFRKTYFGMSTYVHQAQLVEALETVKAREVVMVLLWPEAGKTQTLTDWICMTLGVDPNRRIAVLSEAQDHAKKIVSHIKTRMTDHDGFSEYITRFGPFHKSDGEARDGKPWSQSNFTVQKSDHDERDYSLAARAIKSSAYGSRIDDLIIDDVQSEKNLNQTDEILRTIRQTYLTRGRHMRTVIVGTRLAPGDIYERLIESGVVDRLIELPAMKSDGELTCPEIWVQDPSEFPNQADLVVEANRVVERIRAQVTEPIWEASYQQNPQSEGLATFTDEVLNKSKSGRKVGAAAQSAYVALSLDPALDGGNALTACEHTPDKLSVLDVQIDYGLATNEAIIERVHNFAINYRPSKLIIEIDALQKGIAADLRLEDIAKELGFVVVPHMTSGKKMNNPLAVAAMATSFARGEIDIPWGDQASQDRMAPLLDQLRRWRPDVPTKRLRQDAVMSLWFNWRDWAETRNFMDAADLFESMRLRALPYVPTAVSFS